MERRGKKKGGMKRKKKERGKRRGVTGKGEREGERTRHGKEMYVSRINFAPVQTRAWKGKGRKPRVLSGNVEIRTFCAF